MGALPWFFKYFARLQMCANRKIMELKTSNGNSAKGRGEKLSVVGACSCADLIWLCVNPILCWSQCWPQLRAGICCFSTFLLSIHFFSNDIVDTKVSNMVTVIFLTVLPDWSRSTRGVMLGWMRFSVSENKGLLLILNIPPKKKFHK